MDDERRVADLFRAAVADVPPASFDERDVAARSRRITARRRTRLIAASTVAVVALGGGLLVGTGALDHANGGATTSAGSAVRDLDTGGHTLGSNAPPAPVGPGDGRIGSPARVGPDGCGMTDGELGVALANELPAVGAHLDPSVTVPPLTLTCPAGSRSIALPVRDGSVAGVLIAVLTPISNPTNGFRPPHGTVLATAPAASGQTLTVLSVPSAGVPPAPLRGRLDAVARALAPGF